MAKLNDKQIRGLKPNEGKADTYYTDGAGLYLRVFATGVKQWLYRYKVGEKTSWFSLGYYGKGEGALGLSEARCAAAEWKIKRKQGVDPVQEAERTKRERDEAGELANKEAEALANRMTVTKLFKQWCEAELKHSRKDGGAEIARAFKKDVIPMLGERPIEEVKRADVGALLAQIAERGARRLANRTRAELRQMFGFAIGAGLLEHDPTDRIKAIGGKATERDRHLSAEEIQTLAKRLLGGVGNRLADSVPLTVSSAIWIMLATCCRVGELSTARWADVDLQAGVWTLPDTKNGKAHTIYLSSLAKKHFEELRQLTGGHEYVLPARSGSSKGHIDQKALAKAVADRQRQGEPLKKRRATNTEALALEGGRWTPHDLRRTGATLMGQLGVVPWVIEHCLNHVEPNKIQRTYQQQTYCEEQREAWQKLGEYLERLSAGSD